MKKRYISLFVALVFIFVGCSQSPKEGKNIAESDVEKKVVCVSNYPIYDFTNRIAKDKIELINITGNAGFHGWEPKAKDISDLQAADAFIYNGSGLEVWADELIDNGTISNKIVSVSEGIELLEATHDHAHDHGHEEEEEEHDHEEHEGEHEAEHEHEHEEENHEEHGHEDEHGHEHGNYDSHIWLSLKNAQIMLDNITEALVEIDPENAEFYKENCETEKIKFVELDKEYAEKLSNKKRDTIIVSHEAFGYLCRDYDFKQVGIEGINADGEPSLKQVEEIINKTREIGTGVVFYENTISPKVAEMIAKEVGAELLMLSPLEALSTEQKEAGDDYLSIMKQNLEGIDKALNE